MELAARIAHVAHLGVELAVALLERAELLERERVDRTERRDARLELADALFGRDALGQLEHGRGAQVVGVDAQVAVDHLVQVGDLDGQLGALDLAGAHQLAEVREACVGVLAGLADLLEALGPGARGFELLAVRRVHGLLGEADLVGGAGDERREAPQHLEVELQRLAPAGGLGPLARAPLEALLDLCAALLEQAASLAELGLAPREGVAALVHAVTLLVEDLARAARGVLAALGVGDGEFERAQLAAQLAELLVDGEDLSGEFADLVAERLLGRREVGERRLHARDLVDQAVQFGVALGRGRGGVVESTARLDGDGVGVGAHLEGGRDGLGGGARGGLGLLDGRARDQGPPRRHAPARRREAVALAGHHQQVRARERDLDPGLPVRGDEGAREERVEHPGHVGGRAAARANERAKRRAPGGRRRRRHLSLADRQDQPGAAFAAKRLEGRARGLAPVDDHGPDRRAGGRLHGALPAHVDLDEVEERAEHALQVADDRASARSGKLFERAAQRVGARLGARRDLGGFTQGLVGQYPFSLAALGVARGVVALHLRPRGRVERLLSRRARALLACRCGGAAAAGLGQAAGGPALAPAK